MYTNLDRFLHWIHLLLLIKKNLYLLEVEKSDFISSLFPFSFISYSTIKRIELFHRFLLTNKANWSQQGPTSPVTPGTCAIYTLHQSNMKCYPSHHFSCLHFISDNLRYVLPVRVAVRLMAFVGSLLSALLRSISEGIQLVNVSLFEPLTKAI